MEICFTIGAGIRPVSVVGCQNVMYTGQLRHTFPKTHHICVMPVLLGLISWKLNVMPCCKLQQGGRCSCDTAVSY